MESDQAKRLGARLRKQRQALEMSTHQLARRAGVPQSTIVRLEQGLFLSPRPEKLASVAEALGLDQSEVLKRAKYPSLSGMPAPAAYLRTKYRNLGTDQLAKVTREVEAVLKRHGMSVEAPAKPGDAEPAAGKAKSNSRRKGG